MVQISVNSKIADRKFNMFNLGAKLVLVALLALALAVVSVAINRATGGAWLWA